VCPEERGSEVSKWPRRRPPPRPEPPDFIAPLDEGLRLLELPRVDQVSDVAQQFAEEKERLDLLHCGRLQAGEVVPHDGGPVVAATRMDQPFAFSLGGAEAVGA